MNEALKLIMASEKIELTRKDTCDSDDVNHSIIAPGVLGQVTGQQQTILRKKPGNPPNQVRCLAE
ncbi:hypothetical protein [Legionella geestiana]|uniref:hypothetical protein n=1 Tax=Legionella geestiana TaxID=45065 RepID=UPI00109317C7|nr:hypothetical protein [Legionella geestiana]